MRPLRISLVLAASAAQWACVDEARTETAAAHARDSALVHDLVLAGYDSDAIRPSGRYFGVPTSGASTVTESSGELALPLTMDFAFLGPVILLFRREFLHVVRLRLARRRWPLRRKPESKPETKADRKAGVA